MEVKIIFTKTPNTSIAETNAGGIIFEVEYSFDPPRINDLDIDFKLTDVICIELHKFPHGIQNVVLERQSSNQNYWVGVGSNKDTTHGHFTKSIKVESNSVENGRGLNRRSLAFEGNVCAEGYDFQFYCYGGRVSCEMIPTKNFVDSDNPEALTAVWQLQGRPKSLLKRFGPQELE